MLYRALFINSNEFSVISFPSTHTNGCVCRETVINFARPFSAANAVPPSRPARVLFVYVRTYKKEKETSNRLEIRKHIRGGYDHFFTQNIYLQRNLSLAITRDFFASFTKQFIFYYGSRRFIRNRRRRYKRFCM